MAAAEGMESISGSEHRDSSVLRRTLRFRTTKVGVALLGVTLVLAGIGPFVAPHSLTEIAGLPFTGPSPDHPLGLDNLGRDAFSRFLAGGWAIITVSFGATVLGFIVGIAIGLGAAHRRDWLDGLLMRSSDIVMAFPPIILILLLVAGVGSELWLVMLSVALIHIPRVARIVRAAALEVVVRPFVEAAVARGERAPSIVYRELLPNIWSPILAEFGVRLTQSVILVASLSFLGFGLQPPAADWGLMINENRGAMTIQPWVVVAPVVAIGVLTIAVNLVADGLARAVGRGRDRKTILT